MRTDSPVLERHRHFETRLRPHLSTLRAYARRLCGNRADAEDLVQEVLLKLYEKHECLDEIENLQPWLSRVMYYRFIDLRRSRASQPLAYQHELDLRSADETQNLHDHVASSDPGPDVLAEQAQTQRFVNRLIERLPPAQRDIVGLHEIHGLSLPEIAQSQQVSINTLKSSLLRARLNLREHCLSAGRGYGRMRRRRGHADTRRDNQATG